MKKIILFLHLSLLFAGLNAQPYKPCLDGEMTRWSMLDYHVADDGLISSEIIAFGDTLFNDIMYKKLHIDNWTFFPYYVEESNTNWKNHVPLLGQWEHFYIRESEDASKLYVYNSRRDEEALISDMNLQKGDIFQVTVPYITHEAVVDSVYFKNGLKHVRLRSSDNYLERYYFRGREPLTFIESVGPNFWFIYYVDSFFAVNCFQNQTTFYKNDEVMAFWDMNDCPCGYHTPSNSIQSVSANDYHIFVQKDMIEILFVSDMDIDISVYDVHGRVCYTNKNVSEQKVIITASSLPKGIYILNFFDRKSQQTRFGKIVLR